MRKSKEYLSDSSDDSSDDSSEEMQEVSDSLGGGDKESSLLNNAQDENMDANKNGMREASSREDGEAASESDSDDDINIIIGDIKSIQLEDKPWRQPGRDITNYCNYGFNEVTWRLYCQKRMRSESGEGLILNAGGGGGNSENMRMPQVAITNDNSKYFGIMGPKRAGPPPKKRKIAGTMDVIGSSGLASRRNLDKSPPKGNVMQVMTADRREYSRKPGFPDMSALPPGAGILPPPPFDMPPPGYAGEPTPFYMPETDPYYQNNQPTQDSQWGNDSTWQPTNLAIPMTEGEDDKDMGPKTIPTMQGGESYFLKVTSYRYSLESLPERNLRTVTPAFCL